MSLGDRAIEIGKEKDRETVQREREKREIETLRESERDLTKIKETSDVEKGRKNETEE